ncbi:MAG: hypothetical protein Q9201_005859 [Fulgogasparrea decipioides]
MPTCNAVEVRDYAGLICLHMRSEVGQRPQQQQEAYSTLEPNKPKLSLYDTHKESTRPWHHLPGSSASAPEKTELAAADRGNASRTIFGLRPRTFWIALVVSLVAIVAIVAGAVGGTVGRPQKGNSSIPTSVSGAESANARAVPSASKLHKSTHLASAAWNDTQKILQQRVYLQANDNNIWELSWNSSTKAWFTSRDLINSVGAKSGSPLAAAIAYGGRFTQLTLFYINTKGELMRMNTTDYKNWDTEPVTASDGQIAKPANDSSLAARWYKYAPCADCSENSFVAFQDSQTGHFQVVNSSMTGVPQYIPLPGNPTSGSGCTLNLQWRSPTHGYLRLGYQLDSGQIASVVWNGRFSMLLMHSRQLLNSQLAGTSNRWKAYEIEEISSYVNTALKAPLTSFNLGRGAPTAVPDYLFVLSAGNNGVAVSWWDNSDPNHAYWGTPQSPSPMQKVQPLSPLAANGAGHVFAMQEGVVKEFTVDGDGTTWNLVGNVTGG